ncbi:hypothetical protein PR001_g10802 [Phytophthora rubi]|uniref:Crinkler effector protein N-terminal domain-containing protein n=2 Tax=Phytophthora rubi TaxID=129364 RepID=A0A6A3MRC6_9STRA|nr:hypothetical protein PR001_g10802 [Phytophthora rubi]
MVLLNCAIVGQGSVISIIIEDWKTVALLKKAIKDEKPNTIKCDADGLKLFLSKKEDGSWLRSKDPLVRQMRNGGVPDELKSLYMKEELNKPTHEIGTILPSEIPGGSIHLLVVVPELRVESGRDFSSELRQLQQDIMKLKEASAYIPRKQSASFSDATLGQMEMERLKKNQLLIDFAPIENGEAFWSEETQKRADAITDEAVFNAFVTPYFNAILDVYGLVLVNSAKCGWLSESTPVTKNADITPNGFATHRGMYRGKPEPKDGVQRPSGFRFGVAEEDLFDCLILFESKLTISDAAFGRVVRYLENLCPNESASAILFDRRSFWLISSHRSVVFKVQRAMWATKGSKSLFENFIDDNTPPWVVRLVLACICLRIDGVEGDAFLGRGAYGRVFKVTGRDGEALALKIVQGSYRGLLYREEKALTTAQRTGLTISPVGKLFETPEGAALLLSPVGKPLPQPTTRQEVLYVFGLLWQLHTEGLVHGDPSVPNVIIYGERPFWIDLVEVQEASPHLREIDADILTRSILSIPRTVLLTPTLKELIGNYAENATEENLILLAEEVVSKLRIFG